MNHFARRVAAATAFSFVLFAGSLSAQSAYWQNGTGSNDGTVMVNGNAGIGLWPGTTPLKLERTGVQVYGSAYLHASFMTSSTSTPASVGTFLGYDNTSGTSIGIVGSMGQSSSLAFWTGNAGTGYAERMRINSNGDIAVGVTAPSGILHLQRDQDAMTSVFVRNMHTGGTAVAGEARFVAQTEGAAMTMEATSATLTFAGARQANAGVLVSSGTAGMSIAASAAAGGLRFYTGGVGNERMRIDSGGYAGIGTPNPQAQLHVSGNYARSLFEDTASGTMVRLLPIGATYAAIDAYDSAQVTPKHLILQPNGGFLGVGVLAPVAKVDVLGDIRASASITAGGGITGASLTSNGGSNGLSISAPAGNIRLYAGGAERVNIGSSGNVGIGISAPQATLHVSTAYARTLIEDTSVATMVRIIPNSATYATIDAMNSAQTLPRNLHFQTNGGWIRMGPGAAAPTAMLDVNGDINVSGNINAKYQDVAEWVPTAEPLLAGTVVVLSRLQSNVVTASTEAYDTTVAGVVSAQPGITLGERGADKAKIATTGRVKVHVDASSAPIAIGDLLVTSGVRGMAMKSQQIDIGGMKIHRPGTIVGKALEPLSSGQGDILVLLTLQ